MPTYGNKVSVPTAFARTGPNNNNQQASVQAGATVGTPGRIVRLGGWVEQKQRDSRIAFGIWDVDANGRPTTLVARTDRFEPPNDGNGRVITQPVRNPVSVGAGRRLAFGWMVSAGDVRIGRSAGTAVVYRRDADEVRDFGANATVDGSTAAFAVFAEAEDVPAPPQPGPEPVPPTPVPGVPSQPAPVDPLPPYVPPAVLPPFPTALLPISGTVAQAAERPLLSWDAVDQQGRTVDCRLYLTEVATGTTRNVTLGPPPAGQRWAYRATAALMPSAGMYEWWVEGLIRGTSLRPSATERLLLTWTPPITVTVTSPAENATVATNAPTVTWAVGNVPSPTVTPVGLQARWRGRLIADGTGVEVRRTDWVGSAETTFAVPLSWALRNNRRYLVEIEVDGGGGASAVSPRRGFLVSFVTPADVSVSASRVTPAGDVEASTQQLSWTQSNLPVGEFGGYVVRRSVGGGPEVTVAHLTGRAQTAWADTAGPVNVPVTYRVSQVRVSGGVLTESGGVELERTVPLTVPTLSSVVDGLNRRFPAMWLAEGLGGTFTRPETGVVTWGSGGRPTPISTPASYGASRLTVEVTARTDQFATLRQRAEALQALVESGDPVVWRGEFERLFCRIAAWTWERGGAGQRTMRLELEEIAYDEGVEVIVTAGA